MYVIKLSYKANKEFLVNRKKLVGLPILHNLRQKLLTIIYILGQLINDFKNTINKKV